MGKFSHATTLSSSRVLYWIYAGRLSACVAVFGSAILIGDLWSGGPAGLSADFRRIAMIGLATAAVATPLSFWYSNHFLRREPKRWFVLLQAALDVLLVTAIVHITGGAQSFFPPLLYIAVVSGYALLLPSSTAVILALLVGLAYLLDLVLAYPQQVDGTVLFQITVFAIVATIAGIIGGRLRRIREELRLLEGELRRLRLGTADILRTLASGVLTLDSTGQVAYMNPAAADMLGLRPETWLGKDVMPLLREKAPEIARAVVDTLRDRAFVLNREALVNGAGPSGGDGFGQLTAAHDGLTPDHSAAATNSDEATPHGDGFPLAVSTALHAPPEAPPSVTLVLQDMRVVRQLEDLRLRAGRLEAVAELSASLAHEIRNPMTAIRSAVEQLSPARSTSEDDRKLAQLIVRETDRLDRLLQEFNDFARVDVVERKLIDVPRLIAEAVEIVRQRPEAKDRAVFEVETRGSLTDLWGDPDLLHRTLANLILNAVQVSASSQPVKVRIVADSLLRALVPGRAELGQPVRIRVIDDGPGIPADEIGRIFDPFYTRRPGGTGMGLSIAYRAVQAHGGVLLASSEPGHGATFAVIVPRRDTAHRSAQIDFPKPRTKEP